MELQTIGQVSKNCGISVRMLRYYEQAGLINSFRKEDNTCRLYDEDTVKRLNLIIVLRKLRISVRQISDILNNQDALKAVEIFERNIRELDEEITSLSTIKSILARFTEELRTKADMDLQLDLLGDTNALSIIDSVSFSKNHINNVKENLSMEELNKAAEQLSKRTEVRIVYLPPATVAAVQSTDGVPEWDAYDIIAKFAKDTNLLKIKPDARSFGFDCMVGDKAGYEAWATIPDDMEVPAPFVKKSFPGGLYACHTRAFSQLNSDENSTLRQWIDNNAVFDHDKREPIGMYGHIEEQFVFDTYMLDNLKRFDYLHIDFFMPVKERKT